MATTVTNTVTTNTVTTNTEHQVQPKSVYRFKFSDLVSEELHNFAKQYRFTPRKDVKEAWKRFTQGEIMSQLIDQEKDRLGGMAYDGDIVRKMYTSMRYYYMKLPNTAQPAYRKVVEGVVEEVPTATDSQITQSVTQSVAQSVAQKPKREYTHKEYKLKKEDHEVLNEYLKNNNVFEKPSVLWNQFKIQHIHFQENTSVKKSLFNKIYMLKLKHKQQSQQQVQQQVQLTIP